MRACTGSVVFVAIAAAVLVGLGWPGHALAQNGGTLEFSKANRSVVRAQLELSIAYARQARDKLTDGVDTELESVAALSYQAYRYLRFAVAGVNGLQSNARFPNPLLEMVVNAIEEARERNRRAMSDISESLKYADARASKLPSAITNLDETIEFAHQALDLI